MKLPPASATRKESSAWTEAYAQPGQAQRRRATIARKLALLGIAEADRGTAVLDLCCGNGETLDALYELGFRDLRGSDIEMPPELQADQRFTTNIGDAAEVPLASASVDWVLIIHALHHLGPVSHIQAVLKECYRVLKPGGRLGLVDFPSSLQIRLAFWFFRQNVGLWTPYLRNFGKLIQEEWGFLREYLDDWKAVERLLQQGPFEIESHRRGLFYYYRTLRKPITDEQAG
ncbi:MAG TPA: methyltransferase domain-containing protein [Bryobacteraceae bacterium]|nr:methyltransferase domain-containing protein [Bryobacteraceae bacterium]